MKRIVYIFLCAAVLAACGTKKGVVKDPKTPTNITNGEQGQEQEKLRFVQKVSDQALYQQNVVSKMTFTMNTGKKKISVPASLHMRKDDVIRIQLFVPIIGTEVGRLEFTKDYVLIIDRLHKQYIKADYSKIDFLQNRGVGFYVLQALFWNQLFIPGTKKVGEEQLSQYDVDLKFAGTTLPVLLRQRKMLFSWAADKSSALIKETTITYAENTPEAASLTWTYDEFRAFGSKQYPHRQELHLKAVANKQQKDVKVTFDMNGVSADKDWESRTTVSDRYKAVDVKDVLKTLLQ